MRDRITGNLFKVGIGRPRQRLLKHSVRKFDSQGLQDVGYLTRTDATLLAFDERLGQDRLVVLGELVTADQVTAKAVLMLLAFRANDDRHCYPSLPRIATDACMSERAAQNAIKVLLEGKLITRVKRIGNSPLYTLNLDRTAVSAGPAGDAPRREVHPTPAPAAPSPGMTCCTPQHDVHPTPARGAPKSSINRQQSSPNHHSIIPACDPPPAKTILTAFEEFWLADPRRVGKDKARSAYLAAVKRGTSLAVLLNALHHQRWADDPRYIPHPTTWLNQGRWHDDPGAAAPPTVSLPQRRSNLTGFIEDMRADSDTLPEEAALFDLDMTLTEGIA